MSTQSSTELILHANRISCNELHPKTMASKTLQINSQNPQNPSENTAQKKKAANMEKLKGALMRLLNNQSITPLSNETHKTHIVVEERLTEFLSLLQSPDHPPYAWMIERALQELKERGGSTEESISKFIKKEYDDLPWAHYTMLKHHLVQLCECGVLVVNRNNRYLLASGTSNVKVRRKGKRKRMKRKREWNWEKKRTKRRKNVTGKADDVGCNSGKQKDQGTLNEVNEEENCLDGGIEKQELRFDQVPPNEVVEEVCLVDVAEKGIDCNLDAPLTVTPSSLMTDGEENSEKITVQQQSCEPILGTTDICGQNAQLEMGEKRLEDNHTECISPNEEVSLVAVAEEKGVGCSLDAPLTVTPSLLMTDEEEDLGKITVQKQSCEPMLGIMDICGQNVQLEMGGKHLEDNLTEFSSPERPPGFEHVMLEVVTPVQPSLAIHSKLAVHQDQLNQYDEHDDTLGNGKASEHELVVIEESIPTERMERQRKRWIKRLSGEKASMMPKSLSSPQLLDECLPKSELLHQDKANGKLLKYYRRRPSRDNTTLISKVLPSPQLQDNHPPKSELSNHYSACGKYHTLSESTLIPEVQEKQFSQLQKPPVDSSENLQQPDSELSKLPCLGDYPAEPKCHIKPSEHKGKRKVVLGTQTRRVLRPRPLKPEPQLSSGITKDSFPSSLDQQRRQKPESECRGMEETNESTMSIDQNDLLTARAKCKPSKGANQKELLPKHRLKNKQQVTLRCLGRPSKSRRYTNQNVITKDSFSSPLDLQQRQKQESKCPGTEITNELTMSIDQNEQDLFNAGSKCEQSKGATQKKLLPTHHQKNKQQIEVRRLRRGRPPKSRLAGKANSGTEIVADITSNDHQIQRLDAHPTQPSTAKLDVSVSTEHESLPESVHASDLEQQLEKAPEGATQENLLPKSHHKNKQQTGVRHLGRPPKSRRGRQAKSGPGIVEDVTHNDDQNQQLDEHPTQPATAKLDVSIEHDSLPKSVDAPDLELQLEKPRHKGRGRHPKCKQGASSVEKSDTQQQGKTNYQGRGRPR